MSRNQWRNALNPYRQEQSLQANGASLSDTNKQKHQTPIIQYMHNKRVANTSPHKHPKACIQSFTCGDSIWNAKSEINIDKPFKC